MISARNSNLCLPQPAQVLDLTSQLGLLHDLTELWKYLQNFHQKYASTDFFSHSVLLQNTQWFISVSEIMCLNQSQFLYFVGKILVVSKAVKNWMMAVLSTSCTSLNTATCSSWVTITVFLFLTISPLVQVPNFLAFFLPCRCTISTVFVRCLTLASHLFYRSRKQICCVSFLLHSVSRAWID